jgi:protein-disulfide isomerase
MKLSQMRAGCIGLAGAIALAAPGAAQQTTNDDLKKQLDALRTMVEGIQKDLQDVKGLLARQAPPPSGVGSIIDFGDRPANGERTAKLTMVEFSDYQCPFCGKYVRETYPQIEAEYIATGKVRTVFLDMPLESIHKLAFKGAQAARCAGEQGKYWEMHDRLFGNQTALEPWTPHAQAIGLDVPKFETCLASGKFDQDIRRDMAQAQRVGVSGTPAFMIGRTEPGSSKVKVISVLKGAKPFAEFKAELDRLLEQAVKPVAEAAPGGAPSDEAAPPAAVAPVPTVSIAKDGKLDETTRATLERVLSTAPPGSPAWISAPRSDARAVVLAKDLGEVFTKSGWRTRPIRLSGSRVKPGIYLFAADDEPPAYFETVRQALAEAGFAPSVATGYREYYEERQRADPKFAGFPFVPEQSFLVVVGRVE